MYLVGLMCCKNECDVIEFAVRHYLDPALGTPLVDELIVVDDSTDTTPQILRQLKDEGLPLTIWESGQPPEEYLRGGWPCDRFMHRAAAERQFNWLLHIDTDEFLQCGRTVLEAILASTPPDCSALVDWQTFVPVNGSLYYEQPNPLHTFRARLVETSDYTKAFVPHSVAVDGRMAAGNHYCISNARHRKTGLKLAHVPVRNEEQALIREILRCAGVNRHKFTDVPKAYTPNHYLRDHQFRLGDAELFALGIKYNAPSAPLSIDPEPRMVAPDMPWRYRDLARQNVASALERRLEQLTNIALGLGWEP